MNNMKLNDDAAVSRACPLTVLCGDRVGLCLPSALAALPSSSGPWQWTLEDKEERWTPSTCWLPRPPLTRTPPPLTTTSKDSKDKKIKKIHLMYFVAPDPKNIQTVCADCKHKSSFFWPTGGFMGDEEEVRLKIASLCSFVIRTHSFCGDLMAIYTGSFCSGPVALCVHAYA